MSEKPSSHFFSARSISLRLLVVPLLLVWLQGASAAIYSCPTGNGVVFQDRPCPIEKRVEVTVESVQHYPLAIHESWFALPAQAEERAFCDRRSCECGQLEKRHEGSLVQAVADSLYLDGSWHRYETSYSAWLAAPSRSQESFTHRENMLEASCEVMMSQVLLQKYANDVVRILKQRVRAAEERGYDVEQPCLSGMDQACEYFADVQLSARLHRDARALQRERTEDVVPELTLTDSNTVSDDAL